MSSTVFETVPHVPSSSGSTSSQSTPRKPELHGRKLIAVAPAARIGLLSSGRFRFPCWSTRKVCESSGELSTAK